jgi:hypothetical protein
MRYMIFRCLMIALCLTTFTSCRTQSGQLLHNARWESVPIPAMKFGGVPVRVDLQRIAEQARRTGLVADTFQIRCEDRIAAERESMPWSSEETGSLASILEIFRMNGFYLLYALDGPILLAAGHGTHEMPIVLRGVLKDRDTMQPVTNATIRTRIGPDPRRAEIVVAPDGKYMALIMIFETISNINCGGRYIDLYPYKEFTWLEELRFESPGYEPFIAKDPFPNFNQSGYGSRYGPSPEESTEVCETPTNLFSNVKLSIIGGKVEPSQVQTLDVFLVPIKPTIPATP